MHIPREYDYSLCTDKRDEFIFYILKVRKLLNFGAINFYFVEDIELN